MKPADVPVVLIHGVGLDHTMWFPVMSALPRRTIAYDMIGHGRAAKPAGPYRLQTFVDQLAVIVDALACEYDLVGFSMGALVAQGLAVSPAAVGMRHLVLLNGVHDRTPAERQGILERVAEVRASGLAASIGPALQRWFTPAFALSSVDVVESVRQRLEHNDVRAYADAYEVFATGDAELADKVALIETPTLVATGSDDQRSTTAMASALAEALPRGQLTILPGLRHLTPLEAPQDVARLIDRFTSA